MKADRIDTLVFAFALPTLTRARRKLSAGSRYGSALGFPVVLLSFCYKPQSREAALGIKAFELSHTSGVDHSALCDCKGKENWTNCFVTAQPFPVLEAYRRVAIAKEECIYPLRAAICHRGICTNQLKL